MDEEQRIYSEQGVEEYVRYQLEHENEPFSPGPAFPFVKVRGRFLKQPTGGLPQKLCLVEANPTARGLRLGGKRRPPSSGLMEPQNG